MKQLVNFRVALTEFPVDFARDVLQHLADANKHRHRERNADDGEEAAEKLTAHRRWAHATIAWQREELRYHNLLERRVTLP